MRNRFSHALPHLPTAPYATHFGLSAARLVPSKHANLTGAFVQYLVVEDFKGSSYNACFAVMDGHRGQRAAEYARQNLGSLLQANEDIESRLVPSIKQGKLLFWTLARRVALRQPRGQTAFRSSDTREGARREGGMRPVQSLDGRPPHSAASFYSSKEILN